MKKEMKKEMKQETNIWKVYSDEQSKKLISLYATTNRVKSDTQILVYEIELKLKRGIDVTELLKKITKINEL